MLFEVEHILVCFMILKKVAITFCSPFGPDIVVFIYKEAYEEFKHVLLAFIYDKDDQASPVANEVRSIWMHHLHFWKCNGKVDLSSNMTWGKWSIWS